MSNNNSERVVRRGRVFPEIQSTEEEKAKHRDRVAFVRVCTGKFEKDMVVNHARTGKTIRLSRPQKLSMNN